MSKQALVQAVKKHALANYETDGWDILVECYEDSYIEELIGDAKTVEDAIARCRDVVSMVADYRADIQGA